MPLILIVEDGSGLADSNTYASRAEADAYHESSLYATAWTGATAENKDKALAMATRVLDAEFEWHGYRAGQLQRLEWPRYQVPYETGSVYTAGFLNLGAYWPQDEIPRILKDATAELARLLLTTDRTAEDGAKGIKKLGLGQGALEVEFDPADRRAVIPDNVATMLAAIGFPRGTGMMRKVRR